MIDCPDGSIRDQLPDLVHDRLDPAARETVAAHVAACAACAREVALLAEIRIVLTTTPAVNVARIVASLPKPGAARRSGARPLIDWRIAAAVAALAVGVGSAALRGRPGRDSPTQQVVASDVVIGADLGDASVVELDTLLRDLDSFDGLPAGEPEQALVAPEGAEASR